MTSSKFGQRPPPRRKPSICIAPAGSCLPEYDRRRPLNLYGLVHWKDGDPIHKMHAGGLVITGPRSPAGEYHGEMTVDDVTIGANITDHWPTPIVDVQIFYVDAYWGYQAHNFPPVDMPIDEPFNTRLLETIFIHGIDFRDAWFNE